MAEGYTQVAVDGAGDKIRTNEIIILQPDGTRVTVSMQIVSICDAEGNVIGNKETPLFVDSGSLGSLLENLTDEVRKLRQVIEFHSGNTID
jgi:hypothetical protein